ncbi:MAG: hypothetical protein HOE80_02230 [Candidatus Magasanikbacteria bacterium]|jgi:hypothetical protein|nr:hypothetical protein [Candidatus Magasanikbacteria bacterium]MBT4071517.1 hypothetical protein [Candidatus Magasanikbacteria bacterium]
MNKKYTLIFSALILLICFGAIYAYKTGPRPEKPEHEFPLVEEELMEQRNTRVGRDCKTLSVDTCANYEHCEIRMIDLPDKETGEQVETPFCHNIDD